MRNIRTMIAPCLLLIATLITLPGSGILHLIHDWESHVKLAHGTDSDQIGHEGCPICEYASSPSLQTQSKFELTAPTWVDVNAVPSQSIFNCVSIWVADQGGPPKT
jgi:hypothetical protein